MARAIIYSRTTCLCPSRVHVDSACLHSCVLCIAQEARTPTTSSSGGGGTWTANSAAIVTAPLTFRGAVRKRMRRLPWSPAHNTWDRSGETSWMSSGSVERRTIDSVGCRVSVYIIYRLPMHSDAALMRVGCAGAIAPNPTWTLKFTPPVYITRLVTAQSEISRREHIHVSSRASGHVQSQPMGHGLSWKSCAD